MRKQRPTREQRIIEHLAVGAVVIIASFIAKGIYEWVW
jgi:hypothetical protein